MKLLEKQEERAGRHGATARHCRWVQERLWPFVECELPAAQRTRVEAHLASCPECARGHATTVRARASLAQAPVPRAGSDVTQALAAAVARRLSEREVVRPVMGARHGWATAGGFAAALAGCVLVALIPSVPGRAVPHPDPDAVRPTETRIAKALSPGSQPRPAGTPSVYAGSASPQPADAALVTPDRDFNSGHTRRVPRTRSVRCRAPQPPELLPVPRPENTLPPPNAVLTPPRDEPVMVVREVEGSTPSYAYARCVLPAGNGESATIVEVTREQREQDSAVQVTLVMAGAASAGETGKELLP